ncbi:S-adenosylmethionine:tRNA ribosyltransferase-isomerase [Aquiflexum sp. TKW24L]|uniref:S-adenosylmethionine:tRNA ribosyltransferase-isomerase n=1 Tax=Aquiflexum sp. TKW24L TaxID=2942212 RepID=UPI0020C041EB|nr:S-adenosylmethionine:tRNA ribosyltransferase-isomerase [Aquiflexum sp. TKW24L]MCL6261095.1 S-adenosylmethionine:tRNA ribosyltransferase-isomerase [Aquiflexum sp. TKW24L]
MTKLTAIEDIKLSDYEYTLPEEKIAKFPLENRADSKLIRYQSGIISHHRFFDVPDFIPEGSMMVFNNTRVIPARLIFQRESGAKIEIFLLKPLHPSTVINEVMLNSSSVIWETFIGKLKKWRENEILQGEISIHGKTEIINARLVDRELKHVEFTWSGSFIPFVAIVEAAGEVPIPPYLNRKATKEDKSRYQTVYSRKEGAVAAPTAGLHFTEEVLQNLEEKGVKKEFLTLHVSAGTFQPIKEEQVAAHPMHSEQMVFDLETIQNLAAQNGKIIAVGTTSMRSLESLYWFGLMLKLNGKSVFSIPKLYPYTHLENLPDRTEGFGVIIAYMQENNLKEITGSTEILIMPGYEFRVCDGLITNFHQPSSTLILLVAAFTNGNWKKIYEEALDNNYRFLSYGDSSLLWRN